MSRHATTCEVCLFSKEHGHYPSGVVGHCADCGATWKGLSECHCTTCHRSFSGDRAFLAHLIGDTCRDPSLLKTKEGAPRFHLVERRSGSVWAQSDPRASGDEGKAVPA